MSQSDRQEEPSIRITPSHLFVGGWIGIIVGAIALPALAFAAAWVAIAGMVWATVSFFIGSKRE